MLSYKPSVTCFECNFVLKDKKEAEEEEQEKESEAPVEGGEEVSITNTR